MRGHIFRAAFLLVAFAASVPAQAPAPAATPVLECRDYASKLESCSQYACTFTHPLTGAILERRIVGLAGEQCTTTEAVPGNRTMRCGFPADVRKAVAAFYREAQTGKVTSTATADGTGHVTTTTELNGKAVVNPLQQALERGLCTIGK